MRVLVLGGVLILGSCGGGGTTGTNYSDPPPMATIVATPTPQASETPAATVEPEAVENAVAPSDESNASLPANSM